MSGKVYKRLLPIVLLILPFVDVVTSFMTRYELFPISVGMIVKVVLVLFFIWFLLFKSKSRYRKPTIIYYVIVACWFLGYVVSKVDYLSLSYVFSECISLFRFFYLPILLPSLVCFVDDNKIEYSKLSKSMMYMYLIYVSFLFIPLVTNTAFESYKYGDGFGYSGWFYAANEVGPIVVMLFPFSLKIMKDYKWLALVPVLLGVFSLAMIGTKVSMFGIIGVCVFLLFVSIYWILRKKKFVYDKKVTFVVLVVAVLFSLGMYTTLNKKHEIVDIEVPSTEIDTSTDGEDPDDSIDAGASLELSTIKIIMNKLLSSRNIYLSNVYDIYVESPVMEKIFGIGFTERDAGADTSIDKMIEMDFFDILFRLGVVGFIIYFMPLIYVFFQLFRLRNIKKTLCLDNVVYLFCMILAFGIAFIAGHILTAPSVAFILIIYIVLMMMKSKLLC